MGPPPPTSQVRILMQVLSNFDLVTEIVAFQRGVPVDMHPFVALRGTPVDVAAFGEDFENDRRRFSALTYCLDTWCVHRLLTVIMYLVTLLPFLHDMVVLLAIQRQDITLVAAIDLARCAAALIRVGVQTACKMGNIPMLTLIYPAHKLPWSVSDQEAMLQSQSVEVVAFLSGHGVPFTPQTMDWAASHNCLSIVQWLHNYRTEGYTTKTMDLAAGGGHLEMVQF
ncbi:Aste57867_1779 [Aphanomyces stellatus]|uniref:Aste57867_1779 protein n=1 Tax=Aphanomyces stellatus TaxID=120398 RepID=A0A485K6I7_9STRA|nr:hypothetical protein As57867_001777 [Aphanomyces stellatus]VFT78988.1 Aste57867_1779 [Aphanomyces stellatus]